METNLRKPQNKLTTPRPLALCPDVSNKGRQYFSESEANYNLNMALKGPFHPCNRKSFCTLESKEPYKKNVLCYRNSNDVIIVNCVNVVFLKWLRSYMQLVFWRKTINFIGSMKEFPCLCRNAKVATEMLNLSPCCKTPQHRKKDENKKRRNASTIKLEEKGNAMKMLLKKPCFWDDGFKPWGHRASSRRGDGDPIIYHRGGRRRLQRPRDNMRCGEDMTLSRQAPLTHVHWTSYPGGEVHSTLKPLEMTWQTPDSMFCG